MARYSLLDNDPEVQTAFSTLNEDVDINIGEFMRALSINHDEETVISLTREFCLQSTSRSIWRVGMEFLYMNGFYNELQVLIFKNKNCEDPINQEWGYIYELMLARKERKYPSYKLLQIVNETTTDQLELKCLLGFMKIYLYYGLSQFEKLGNFLDSQYEIIAELEDSLLISHFHARLHQVLFIYYWKRNELIIARKYAFRVINHTYNQEIKANLHTNLSLSYVFENFTQCISHAEESIKFANMYNNQELVRVIRHQNIPFITAHFGHVDNIETEDLSETAHIEIARGNFKQAQAILKDIPIDTPFRKYYYGLAYRDRDMLLSSYNDFIEKRSDYFFSRLPLNALRYM